MPTLLEHHGDFADATVQHASDGRRPTTTENDRRRPTTTDDDRRRSTATDTNHA